MSEQRNTRERDMMSDLDAARAEAEKRYPDSNQNDNRITYPVGTLIADFRRAFEKGAEWAASRSQEPRCEHGIELADLCLYAEHVANAWSLNAKMATLGEFDRWLEQHDREVAARALRGAIQAHRDLHPTYGSTAACWGGIGGAMMTPHCAFICDNPAHDPAREAWHQVERTYFEGAS